MITKGSYIILNKLLLLEQQLKTGSLGPTVNVKNWPFSTPLVGTKKIRIKIKTRINKKENLSKRIKLIFKAS